MADNADNSFVKFKNEIRKNRNKLRKEILDIKSQIAKLEEVIREWNLYRVASNTNESKQQIKANIIKEIEKLKKILEDLLVEDTIYQNFIKAFDNEKAINFNEKFDLLLFFLVDFYSLGVLNIEDINKLIGASIYFNINKRKQNQNNSDNVIPIELGAYYNIDGSFVYNVDNQKFLDLLKILFIDNRGYKIAIEVSAKYEKLYVQVYQEIHRLYLKFCQDFENRQKTINESVEEIRQYKSPAKLLYQYYQNGMIIKMPDDIDEFRLLLEESGKSKEEQAYILGLLNIDAVDKVVDKPFSEYDDLLNETYRKIKTMNSKNLKYGKILNLLEEINAGKELYQASSCEDDKMYIKDELLELFDQLEDLIAENELTEIDNNLGFLLDKNGNSYFDKDLYLIDKGIRNRVFSLIKRINSINCRSFRQVYVNNDIEFGVYEVLNRDVHIVFVELYPGIYMIVGASVVRSGYNDMINRVVSNKEYIVSLINLLNDPVERSNYLINQLSYMPNEGLKRIRMGENND